MDVHVVSGRDGTQHLGLGAVGEALAGVELRTAVGELDDDVGPIRRAAASSTALMVLVPVTLTAGRAYWPDLQAATSAAYC